MLQKNPLRTAIQTIACVTALVALPGCEEGTGDGAGGSTSTDSVEFSALNFESEAKFIGPRLHTIVSETYRNLHYIHLFLNANTLTIEDKMSLAGGGNPGGINPGGLIDDLLDISFTNIKNIAPTGVDLAPDASGNLPGEEDCGENEGVETKFIDVDGNDAFSAGDQILRDFGNVGCQYDFYSDPTTAALTSGDDGRPAYWPSNITGSILYEFDADTTVDSIFSGTATFGDPNLATALNLEVSGGLLSADNNQSSASFNGTLNFLVDFSTGNATFSNISFTLTDGTTSVAGPVTFTITELERQVNVGGTRDIVTITGGVLESQTSGQRFTFSTQPFNNLAAELSGLTNTPGANELPDRGAIVVEGGSNTSVRVRSEVGGGAGIVELDIDGDGVYNDAPEAEPNGWAWFVYGFLMDEGERALD